MHPRHAGRTRSAGAVIRVYFKKDGDRPFAKREGGSANGAKKPYVSKDGGAKRAEGRTFRKDGAPRSEGHAQRSAKKRAY